MNKPKGFNCNEFPELNEFFLKLTTKFNALLKQHNTEMSFIGANIVKKKKILYKKWIQLKKINHKMMHHTEEEIGHVNHLDNSSITMNICLSDQFEGGDVFI